MLIFLITYKFSLFKTHINIFLFHKPKQSQCLQKRHPNSPLKYSQTKLNHIIIIISHPQIQEFQMHAPSTIPNTYIPTLFKIRTYIFAVFNSLQWEIEWPCEFSLSPPLQLLPPWLLSVAPPPPPLPLLASLSQPPSPQFLSLTPPLSLPFLLLNASDNLLFFLIHSSTRFNLSLSIDAYLNYMCLYVVHCINSSGTYVFDIYWHI